MKITELADMWEQQDSEAQWPSDVPTGSQCASDLRNALPKWTRVHVSMEKLPNEFIAYFNDGHVDMYLLKDGHHLDFSLAHAGMTHWRPLCDLDYPPKDET